jgi:G:T-mismatch repair DNA endonuclease (very short patch repair protein)
VTDKDFTTTIRFPADWEERIRAWADHHGTVNAAVNRAVMEAVLAFEGEETTRVRVQRIDANVEELNRKFELLQSMGWAQLNALELTVKVSDSDWARIERLVQARG